MSQAFKDACNYKREQIEKIKREQIEKIKGPTLEMLDMIVKCGPEELKEVRANIKIAYRHLEDARMRFGKAIQAASGGVSIYDQEKPVVANEKGADSDADLDSGPDNQ